MKKLLLIVITGLLQAGCATTAYVWQSQEEVSLQKSNADILAKDIVTQIAYDFPVAQTVFRFLPDEDQTIGIALEAALRSEGFAIASSAQHQNKSVANMAYTFDHLDNESTYWIGVKVGPKYRLDRVYTLNQQNQLRSKSGFFVRGGQGLTPKKKIMMSRHKTANDLHRSWSVQVFASSDMRDIKHHQSRLAVLGYNSHIIPVGTTGRMKAIRLGPFSSYKQASIAQKIVQSKLFDDAFVIAPKKVAQS